MKFEDALEIIKGDPNCAMHRDKVYVYCIKDILYEEVWDGSDYTANYYCPSEEDKASEDWVIVNSCALGLAVMLKKSLYEPVQNAYLSNIELFSSKIQRTFS